MKKIYLSILMAVIGFSTYAQSYQRGQYGGGMPKDGVLKGKVKDMASGKYVEYATIALYNQRDSALAGGTISEPDGSFVLNNLPYGMYYLDASFVGYKKTRLTKILITPQKKDVDIGTLTIEPAVRRLNIRSTRK